MEIITMESTAYKELVEKIDRIAGYVRDSERSKKGDGADVWLCNEEVMSLLGISRRTLQRLRAVSYTHLDVYKRQFVPYNLRAAYGLPTPEHHEGVYAYYFYRLVQRARRVWMLYCSHADDKSTGEPSRYIYQLNYESGFPVRKVEVGVDVNLAETDPIEVAKDCLLYTSRCV